MQKRILLFCTLIVAALTNDNEKPLDHRHGLDAFKVSVYNNIVDK
ncbi:MAG: hypothetical protein ACLPSL_14505 [Smithella sp.]